ncbi:hypothetical protein B0J12DRAFT_690944 [Macrophomina phaseolina]|uniref:Transposase n=1 Tax=Macrophomina phaseolina TaxID=35725 RepID=A0ABQ8FRF9_9PEZI|nr:hypothetical protein B0J12DRAFT_690944 [Macrophomina phaseolina]
MPYLDIATRAQAVTLKHNRFSNKIIKQQTGVPSQTANRLYATAKTNGWQPDSEPLLDEYLANKPKSGRPSKHINSVRKKVVEAVKRTVMAEKKHAKLSQIRWEISLLVINAENLKQTTQMVANRLEYDLYLH